MRLVEIIDYCMTGVLIDFWIYSVYASSDLNTWKYD